MTQAGTGHDIDHDGRLMSRWQRGWGQSRRFPPPVHVDGGLVVHIGEPGREVEYIALTTATAVHRSLAALAARAHGSWLTAPTRDRGATAAIAEQAGLELSGPEWLMSRTLDGHPGAELAHGYQIEVEHDAGVLVAEVFATDGSLAAQGRIAVRGTDAVADQFHTAPTHRRRGLGRTVMAALVDEARRRGAHTGLLIASPDGRRLYDALGWRTVADIVVATRPRGSAGPLE